MEKSISLLYRVFNKSPLNQNKGTAGDLLKKLRDANAVSVEVQKAIIL